MTTEKIFKTNSQFKTVTFDESTGSWNFIFENKIYALSTGFWRIIKANRIVIVSFDNGHQFGQTKPLDLIEETKKQLTGKKLEEIKIIKDTGDLILNISLGIRIEIYIASTGYETYEFEIEDKRFIGLGSGDIEIIDKK